MVLLVKNLPANAGDKRDTSSIPGSGRFHGEVHGKHSSVLAWRIPQTETGGLQSIVFQKAGHDWSYLAHTENAIPVLCAVKLLLLGYHWISVKRQWKLTLFKAFKPVSSLSFCPLVGPCFVLINRVHSKLLTKDAKHTEKVRKTTA